METKYLKAWVIFFIVVTIGSLVVGAIVGGIAGFMIALTSGGQIEQVQQYQWLFQLLGFLAALPVSFLTYKWSVSTFILSQHQAKLAVAESAN